MSGNNLPWNSQSGAKKQRLMEFVLDHWISEVEKNSTQVFLNGN